MSHALQIDTASVFEPLLKPSRYKGAFGGRGSGKSHFFAELMIEEHIKRKVDCVCLRETLKSLEFSVKKLLEMKIEQMGVGNYFTIQDKRILSQRGGVIIFQGMQNHTADSIKSLESFDIAWFAESQKASQTSLDLLRPTIRKEDSELWFDWNPENATDPIDVLLRGGDSPPGAVVVESNYLNNPWLPETLKKNLSTIANVILTSFPTFGWVNIGRVLRVGSLKTGLLKSLSGQRGQYIDLALIGDLVWTRQRW